MNQILDFEEKKVKKSNENKNENVVNNNME